MTEPVEAPPSKKPPRFRWKMIPAYFLIAFAIFTALVAIFQNKLVYFPRRYPAQWKPGEGDMSRFVSYTNEDGRELWGLLIPPRENAPATLSPNFYLVFSGNGSTAMDMSTDYETFNRTTGCGFFLVDYRGYGFNEGLPTEKGITADARAAYTALKDRGYFDRGIGVLGQSLGSGVAMSVAESFPVDRLILVSPFTSIDDMARIVVFWPLYYFCFNHFPNDKRLAAIMRRPREERPEISIFHGRMDEVVPFHMGESLAAPYPEIRFFPSDGAHHMDVYGFLDDDVEKILRGEGVARQETAQPR